MEQEDEDNCDDILTKVTNYVDKHLRVLRVRELFVGNARLFNSIGILTQGEWYKMNIKSVNYSRFFEKSQTFRVFFHTEEGFLHPKRL